MEALSTREAPSTGPPYRYRPVVLEELLLWGIAPDPTTEPARVYELLKAIYTFEIRELKARRREAERVLGPQPLEEYRRGLHALKERYPLLTLPSRLWIEEEPGAGFA